MALTSLHSRFGSLFPQFLRHLTKLPQSMVDTRFSNRRFQVFAQFLQCRFRFLEPCPCNLCKTIRKAFKAYRVTDKLDILDLLHSG